MLAVTFARIHPSTQRKKLSTVPWCMLSFSSSSSSSSFSLHFQCWPTHGTKPMLAVISIPINKGNTWFWCRLF